MPRVKKNIRKKKPKTKAPKKMGRPKKDFDKKVFEGLCSIQCTMLDICRVFDVTKPTLERWCKDIYGQTFFTVFKEKRVGGIISLRQTGFKLAKTNAAVWIFHAKNFLGMKDQPIDEGDIAVAQPVKVLIEVSSASK